MYLYTINIYIDIYFFLSLFSPLEEAQIASFGGLAKAKGEN